MAAHSEQPGHTLRVRSRPILWPGLTDLLRSAGFGDIRLYGTWQGTPYDLNAERLIAVAAKAELHS
jgi:hypothetical protein